jgi:predicted nucleotidyltransferase
MASDVMKYLPGIKQLLQQHFVERAYLFGSSVKGNMHAHSDVDILVRFTPELDYETYANNYFNLLHALQNLLNKSVDLVAEETLSNPYLIQDINLHKFAIL